MAGFDFARDPLVAKKPMMTFAELMKADIDAKTQSHGSACKWLEQHYDLKASLIPKMSRETASGRADGEISEWPDLGKACPNVTGRNPQSRTFSLSVIAAPEAESGGPGFPANADRHVSEAGALMSISICPRTSCRNFLPAFFCVIGRNWATFARRSRVD